MLAWVWEKVQKEAEGGRGRACLFKYSDEDARNFKFPKQGVGKRAL